MSPAELRQAINRLRTSEALLLQSQRVARIGHYVFTVAIGQWTSSPTLDDIFGITEASVRTFELWQTLLHPAERLEMTAYFRDEVLGRGQPFDREYRIMRHCDGAERWVHGLGTLESDGSGGLRMFGTIQDVTERRRSENTVLEAKLRLDALFQGARDAIFIAEPGTGLLSDANRQAEFLIGRPRSELIGMHQSQLHPPELNERLRHVFAEHASGAILRTETEVLHRDGSRIPVEINGSVVVLPDGSRLVMGMFRDIRDRVRLQEHLQQSQRLTALGQLAGGIAHDFNNQLTGISGYAEMLIKEAGDQRQRKWAEAIFTAAQRSADLTRQLLAFARKGMTCYAAADMHLVITEVVEMLRRSLDRRISIVLRLAEMPCLAQGDPSQLHHALLNLAINARDAMPEGGELSFATRIVALAADHGGFGNAAGNFIEITVSDTGCGMTDAIRRRIFEPFFSTKEPGKGTGLGLSAVYGVITNHGGAITVTSTPGQGSVFTLHLPLLKDATITATSDALPVHALVAHRILVVDDEGLVGGLTGEMLRSFGHTVVTSTSAEQALMLCRNEDPFDLVLLDLMMPRLSGREAFLALRAIDPGLRVLIVSGYSLNGEVQSILDLGAVGFLQKPFSSTDLAWAIKKAVGRMLPKHSDRIFTAETGM
ncbi:MAG: PAS domain S-box protein [Planctomycetota bacterium]